MDRFAMFQTLRRYNLPGTDAWILQALTYLVDYRTRRWSGSILELAQDVGHTTGTTAKSVQRLADVGLIAVHVPFTRHSRGQIEVTCYSTLVRVSRSSSDEGSFDARYAKSTSSTGPDQQEHAETLRTKDAVKEEAGREPRATTGWEATPALGAYLRGAEPDDEPFPRSWVS